MSFAHKKSIVKQLRDVGVKAFDIDAVNLLAQRVEDEGVEFLNNFISAIKSDGFNSDRLTTQNVEAVLAQLCGKLQAFQVFESINAFDVPKTSYDNVGRRLYQDTTPRNIFAGAQAKQQLYLDRLLLINQRIRRNSIFQPSALNSTAAAFSPQLTDIQSLKGIIGARKFVIGCIMRSEDGRYLLEDNSGSVPLNLSAAQTAAGFYTENCIVIAEGEMHIDGVFHASALGFPPTEPRDDLPMAAKRLNFFGGAPLSTDDEANLIVEEMDHMNDRLVVLSNVHLDSKEVMDGLRRLFTGYLDVPMGELPVLFVFMGNFHSKASASGRSGPAASGSDVDFAVLKDHFNALASLIEQYPRIRNESRFVFMPGPGDPGPSAVLPQPPIPAYFTGELRRVLPEAIFASNPCRIRFLSQQIVLFRYDILKRMRRRCLIPPRDSADLLTAGSSMPSDHSSSQATEQAMWGHLALTLLQQSHLCPLPLLEQPIYWQYDHALHLYPLPHAVIVADSSPQAEYVHEACKVMNPGSFAEGLFSGYLPCTQKFEPCAISIEQQYEEEEEDLPDHDQEEADETAKRSRKITEGFVDIGDDLPDHHQGLDQGLDLGIDDEMDADLDETLRLRQMAQDFGAGSAHDTDDDNEEKNGMVPDDQEDHPMRTDVIIDQETWDEIVS